MDKLNLIYFNKLVYNLTIYFIRDNAKWFDDKHNVILVFVSNDNRKTDEKYVIRYMIKAFRNRITDGKRSLFAIIAILPFT